MKFVETLNDGTVLLTAPVMVPGALDCDGINGEPPLSVEQVQYFKESYDHYGFLDHEHTLTEKGRKIGKPFKSRLLQENTLLSLYDGTECIFSCINPEIGEFQPIRAIGEYSVRDY